PRKPNRGEAQSRVCIQTREKRRVEHAVVYKSRATLRAADRAVHEPGDTELRSRQGPELQQRDDHQRADADREDELVAQFQELEQEKEVPVRSRDGDCAGVGGRLELKIL